ncbi:MAG: multiheme c-type cytochrome [Candidatus Krumholzibacteriales bacterium]
MARRAEGFRRELEKDGQALILCAGDFFGEKGILEMLRGKFLGRMMMKMGYSAVAVGEKELNYQGRAIRDIRSEGLPVICANLFRDGVRLFPPYKIVERRGNRIGIMALLDSELPPAPDMVLEPPLETGNSIAEELKDKGCNIVILLAHMKREKISDLALSIEGVDLIIRGHAEKKSLVYDDCSDRSIKSFEEFGVPVLFAGDKGRIIGKTVLLPFEDGGCMLADTTVIHLDSSFETENNYTAHVNNYMREEARKKSIMEVRKNVARDERGNIRPVYMGMQVCGRCHRSIAHKFLSTRHYKAYQRVSDRDDRESCLKCHATGYGEYSGFGSEEAANRDIELKGVTCEECHGPGSEHSRDGRYVETARNSCRRCHTPERSPGFDYQKFLKKACSIMRADSTVRERAVH